MTYTPKGRMAVWLAAMRAEPDRIWTSSEAAVVMGIRVNKVGGYAAHAQAAGAIYRHGKRGQGKPARWGLNPPEGAAPRVNVPRTDRLIAKSVPRWEPGDDIRVPKVVPGWSPPKMTCARQGG